MSIDPAPIFLLDFRRGVVEEVSSGSPALSTPDVPVTPPGVTFAALGTPPRADEPPAGS